MVPEHCLQVVVGAYAYLDGVKFVRISVAMDGIIQVSSLSCTARQADAVYQAMTKQLDNVALAYLCTPTDTHLIPASAKAATRTNRARAPLWQVVIIHSGTALSMHYPLYLYNSEQAAAILDCWLINWRFVRH